LFQNKLMNLLVHVVSWFTTLRN